MHVFLRVVLSALAQRGVPAAALVTCDNVRADTSVLRRWADAGLEIDNHSAAHQDLNRVPLDAWLADVRRCDRTLEGFLGRDVRYFRFPYLHRGPTPERRAAAQRLLAELGYEAASVSVDNSEWILARAYAEASERADRAAMAEIARLYVRHVLDAVTHYRAVAQEKVGREVRHILLLHANALAADHLGDLLDALAEDGARFITLEEALRDPVYSRPDAYVGAKGLSWLYRIEPATPEDVAWDDARAEELERRLAP